MNPKAARLMHAVRSAPADGVWVEIGCVRSIEELDSEGWSTVYLAREAWVAGKQLWSVDVDETSIAIALEVLQNTGEEYSVDFYCSKGAAFLLTCTAPIAFLLLDGGGGIREPLLEFMAAEGALVPGAVIVIDDVQQEPGFPQGKGTVLIPHLEEHGWDVQIFNTFAQYKMAVCRRKETEL